MDIYVGRLSPEATVMDLRRAFGRFGQVVAARIVIDESGISRGIGFVTMPNKKEAYAAIGSLNGRELMGQAVAVARARPRIVFGRGRFE